MTYWKGHFDQVKIRVNYSHIVNEKQDFSNAYFIRRVYFGGWYDGMIVIENGFKGLFNALQKLVISKHASYSQLYQLYKTVKKPHKWLSINFDNKITFSNIY